MALSTEFVLLGDEQRAIIADGAIETAAVTQDRAVAFDARAEPV